MTVVVVTEQPIQKVTVSTAPEVKVTVSTAPQVTVEVYKKGDTGEQGIPGETASFLEGVKQTGIDGGILGQQSITDDYIYTCVKGGIAGEAIWKKSLMFQT